MNDFKKQTTLVEYNLKSILFSNNDFFSHIQIYCSDF